MRRHRIMVSALAGVCALLLSGCLASDEKSSGSSSDTKKGDGSVEMIGAISDAEAEALTKSLEPFEDESGIDVKYT
ncbi:MAG: hypothetical protein H0T17_01350, partial [Propionibacteriales bacterium]|nr:hypothetical protein [Propionibacteriales bacterium]